MKNILVFFAVFVLIHQTNVFSQESNTMKTVKFENYSISHPLDKTLIRNDGDGFTIYLNQRDNITMEIKDLAGYLLDLDTYSEQFRYNYFQKTNVTGFQSERISINNFPCQKFVASYDDGHGKIEFKVIVYIWVKNNWAYNLWFVAGPNNFDALKPIALKVMNSFRITQ